MVFPALFRQVIIFSQSLTHDFVPIGQVTTFNKAIQHRIESAQRYLIPATAFFLDGFDYLIAVHILLQQDAEYNKVNGTTLKALCIEQAPHSFLLFLYCTTESTISQRYFLKNILCVAKYILTKDISHAIMKSDKTSVRKISKHGGKIMENLIKKLTAIFIAILSIFSIGSSGFQPTVKETVTTATTEITVEAINKTGLAVTNPRVESLEKLEGDNWVEIGAYDGFIEPYIVYHPLGLFKETVKFKNICTAETLPEGEYRVVVTFGISPSTKLSEIQTAYAYFQVVSTARMK